MTTEGTPASTDGERLTYKQAANYLVPPVSQEWIRALVSQRVLHPEKLRGMRAKLLRRDELDWYQAIRDGQPAEHPFLGKGVAAYLEAARIALKPRGVQKWNAAIAATQGTTQAAYQQLLLETIPALEQTLLRLAAREDVTEDVKQFRTSPELQPIRLAIYELAALIAPEGGHKQ